MYTNVKQHYNCQSQNNFSTLNITLRWALYPTLPYVFSKGTTVHNLYHHERICPVKAPAKKCMVITKKKCNYFKSITHSVYCIFRSNSDYFRVAMSCKV